MNALSMSSSAEAGPEPRAAERLLDLVATYRTQACARLLAQAGEQAQAILAQARAEARQRVHRAVEEERARLRSEWAAAQAHWQTQRRHQAQARQAALLAEAWQALGAALRRRWDEPATRRAWIAKLLAEARETLPPGEWEIRHPPGLPDDELQRLCAELPGPSQCLADAQLSAGLRIRAGHLVLDGSLEGLAAERARLQGELLLALGAWP